MAAVGAARWGDPPWRGDPTRYPDGFTAFGPIGDGDSIPGRFAGAAARFPDCPALVGPDGAARTYAEVLGRVHRIAHRLHAEAGAPGDRVAVLCDHGPALVEAILAVLAAGRVVVVVDPQAPAEVSAAALAHAEPAAIVHDAAGEGAAAALAGPGTTAVALDALVAGDGDPGPPPVTVEAGDPAMLAFTSGTTGEPKAAVLPHRALLQVMRGATDALGISPGDRLPMLFPVSLAVAAYPMFLPLVNGAALCTFDMRSEGLAPFPSFLAGNGISVIYMSPTVARFMDPALTGDLPALRLVVLGGERVDADAVEAVRSVFPGDVLVANGYGTTETGVLTFFFTTPGEAYPAGTVPVGHAIEGMDLLLEQGELLVRSRYLFDGYWRDPAATAAVLSEGTVPGEQVYRTGDLATVDEDGLLTLGGRADDEVKVRGHRINPAEVEQALLALDEVVDAVVEGRPDRTGTNRLVAWVVAAEGVDQPASVTVRTALSGVVQAPMVPADLIVVDQLPMLPNGKLDRRGLPDPGGRPIDMGMPVAPRTDLERQLVELWVSVLTDDIEIGVTDDFAALGGHSLDAARLLVAVEDQLGVTIPMSELLTVRTIEDMAVSVERIRATRGRVTTVVPVQQGSPGRPKLFFCHDLYGSAYVLRHLAPLLGADQPLYGFESILLRGPASPFKDLETMAMRYVIDLRLAQPEGPYHLAGYSFGGVTAFEMARQLVEAGEEVAFLGVVDVGPGYRGKHYDPRKVLDKPWMGVPMPPDRSVGWRDRVDFYRRLARDPGTAASHVLLRTGLDRWTDPLLFRRDLHRYGHIQAGNRTWYAWRTHWELARSYRWEGRDYPGDLTLFWAEATASTDATMGWGTVVKGDIEVVRFPTPHDEVMSEERAAELAVPLRRALDRVS